MLKKTILENIGKQLNTEHVKGLISQMQELRMERDNLGIFRRKEKERLIEDIKTLKVELVDILKCKGFVK